MKSFYNSLYKILNIKFIILRKYLNDALVKEWTKHFISSINALVLFVFNKNNNLRLCVNYWELNKTIIKNRHSLSLISETLNYFNKAVRFTKLNFKNAYYRIRIRKDNE